MLTLLTAAALATATLSGQAEARPPAPVTYREAAIDGVKIFYRDAGSKDAPVIVLLHGYPSSSRMWDPLIPLLADRYRLIAPDYPGFGLSDTPSPSRYAYTFDHLAQTMSALLGQLGIERYVLFMQDYGGPVGFRIAEASPEKVLAMVVQNANAYREGLGPKWAKIAEYWADPCAHADQVDAFMSLEGAKARHVGLSPHPDRYNPELWTDEFAMLSRPGQREIQSALLYDYRTNIAAYPRWQTWLRDHRPPLLVVWGRYDIAFVEAGAIAFRRDVPDAEIHLLNAGHFALDESASEIASLTREFLERYDRLKR